MDTPVLPMPAPLCLVTNKDGVLALNPAALAVLHSVTQPVVVVAIAGLYRTGKSFLMNQLAQKRTGEQRGKPHPFWVTFCGISDSSLSKGFPLGPTVYAETKGIWMWCLPHPRQPRVTLVLLDTEGLGDPNKVSAGVGGPRQPIEAELPVTQICVQDDDHSDAWIFTLALLLSSTLVYNSIGTIDQRALEQLRYGDDWEGGESVTVVLQGQH